jgi:NTP pyrophosphatase (non-canonical NTP hydrolase)
MKKTILEPGVYGIKKTQQEFEIYQKIAFGERSSNFFALELCGECGELANLEKKIWRDPNFALSHNKFSEEAADVFIALINYCNSKKIDLEKAIKEKLKTIENRRQKGQMGEIS